MVFRGKKLADLQEQDIQRLKTDHVQERDTIEYKNEMYGNSRDEKREMLKDITSMANHRGGFLIIGIDEDDEGIPTGIPGIEPSNSVERIRNSCLDNIEKRIVGLDIEDVRLANGKDVIIISIPESINAPHMVIHEGLNQFWKRHGRQKDKMTIQEIGESFDKKLSNLNRSDRFLYLRKSELLEDIGEKTCILISSSPAMLLDEIIFQVNDENLRNIINNTPNITMGLGDISCGLPHATINGLRADNTTPYDTDNPTLREFLEVFLNGHIEFGKIITRNGEGGRYFAGIADTALIVNFMKFIEGVYERYLPLRPLVVNFAIFNAKGMWLAATQVSIDDRLVKWQKQHLELGKFYIENISEEYKLCTKRICDRLYQAFNRSKCDLFDENGTFRS